MLPKLPIATFEYTLPISKKKIHYKPYTVREEKILLIAAASDNPRDMVNAVKQVINNCIVEEDVDVVEFPLFDLEVLLLLLRIVSTSNEVELKFHDKEDDKIYDFTISLEDVISKSIAAAKPVEKVIELKDGIGVIMKELTIDVIMSGELDNLNDPEKMYDVLQGLIDSIYDKEELHKAEDASREEFTDFLDSFDKDASSKLSSYFIDLPKLSHTLTYKNTKGTEREIRLEGINDFFQ